MNHTILGETEVEVFRSSYKGRELELHVAHDTKTDTVWLDRITVKGGGVSEYGTQENLILAGALNAKPIDYSIHARNMHLGEDCEEVDGYRGYVSIKPLLDQFPWVKHYREALESRNR